MYITDQYERDPWAAASFALRTISRFGKRASCNKLIFHLPQAVVDLKTRDLRNLSEALKVSTALRQPHGRSGVLAMVPTNHELGRICPVGVLNWGSRAPR